MLAESHIDPVEVVPTPAPSSRRSVPWWPDVVALAALIAVFPLVHNIGNVLRAPYWVDEAWVAMSVRLPLSDLPVVTSSTPIGWTFLLRLIPDQDRLRILPVAFGLLTVLAAYMIGRSAGWASRSQSVLAGLTCALMVLLMPAAQLHEDLKQYTADAAVALTLFAVSGWVERGPTRPVSRRRLAVLVIATGAGMLLSDTTAIVAPAIFASLSITALARRQWPRLLDTVLAGALAGSIIATIYVSIVGKDNNPTMRQFWTAYFPTPSALPHYVRVHVQILARELGVPTLVLALLCLVGVVVMIRRGRPATAMAVMLVPLLLITMGVSGIYPLLDQRTSHFAVVTALAVGAVGAVAAAAALASVVRRYQPRFPTTALMALLCLLVVSGYAYHNKAWIRYDGRGRLLMYQEDIRTATTYVAEHRGPGDVVVVNDTGRWGFAFYWPGARPRLVEPYDNTIGWSLTLPDEPRVYFLDGDAGAIVAGLRDALTAAERSGPGARVWLIRTQMVGTTRTAWDSALATVRLQYVTHGREPVALVMRP